MLETLDSIPWSSLEHAYGDASDVPELIRGLASPERKIYEEALGHLWSNVTHQGTVYSATPYVVPFFCELLEAPDVQNKQGLLYYLATIAHGASYHDVHIREPERRDTPEMQKLIEEELSDVEATSKAVSDGYATYLFLLRSSDEPLRAFAAHTLACCRSHVSEFVPEMKRQLAQESSPMVSASLLLSLGLLLSKDEETAHFFEHALREASDPLIQIGAAMGSAFALREQTGEQALHVLVGGYELAPEVKERFRELPFAGEDDLDATISVALRSIGLSIAPLVLPTLIRAVRQSDRWSGLTFVPSLFYFALGGQKITRDMTVYDLSDIQRDALNAVYETEELWGFGNMSFTVGSFFEARSSRTSYSIWDRKDLGKFLAGKNAFDR